MQRNTVYFVRHGQNPANVNREFSYKIVDYPLTELGVRQAEQTAVYFKGLPIDAIYSSPLKRAKQTAEIIAAATGHAITIVEEFREINCGSFDGTPPTDEMWAHHDDILRRWRDGEHDISFPEGENYHTLVARARAGLDQVIAGQDGKQIVVVTHGGIVGATIKDVCRDLDLDLVWRVPNANCAITEIQVQKSDGETWGTLTRWAACDHLSD
jgi:broad specificity phosphatase PhoE